MLRHNDGVRWLVPVLCLLVVGAALSGDGATATARRLVIDPATFGPLPFGEAPEPAKSRSRALVQTGPRIMLRGPDDDSVFQVGKAVTVHVEFLPAFDGSPPDMSTLNVRVRKGWFGRDITEVIAPFVEGDAIRVPEVDFLGYTGKFRFAIRVKDHRNRESEVEFRVSIVNVW